MSSQCRSIKRPFSTPSHQSRQRRELHLFGRSIEPLLSQIPDAWSESKPQEMAQREDMIHKAGRIHRMFFNPERGLVIEQSILF